MVLTRNHSGKSNQPKGPSGEGKNRVNAMNVQHQHLANKATSTTSIPNKADQGTKSRSETIPHVRDMNKGINPESQWQIKPTERPIRRSE
ncbi:hypothetical protein [Flavitalea sp.]